MVRHLALPLLILSISLHGGAAKDDSFDLRMPSVLPEEESYVCTSTPVNEETFIVGFEPLNEKHNAHHILLFACEEPGSDESVWDCGEMSSGRNGGLEKASPCASKPQILYAWAHGAPKLELPADVGFKVGGASGIKSVVMQVHYMQDSDERDESGVSIKYTDAAMPKQASTMLLVTGGELPPLSIESFETACTIDEDVVIHPFAYRTHTHKHGVDVSGWIVREKDGSDEWTLLGRRDPQLPQMFVPVNDSNVVIRKGDVVTARCVMRNDEARPIAIGPRGEDEMCNLYVMYWTESRTLTDGTCFSPGPPAYFWSSEAGLNHIPV